MRRPLETRRAYRLTIALTHGQYLAASARARANGVPLATWIANGVPHLSRVCGYCGQTEGDNAGPCPAHESTGCKWFTDASGGDHE